VQADLTDAGSAYAVVRGCAAIVHAAAIPEPQHHPAHVVFHNNLMSTFNVVEAAVRLGVRRLVHLSSVTVHGFFFAERAWLPEYAPIDEEHPIRPQDPYALAKHVGEQLCDAAVRRSDLRCISVRPSWVQWESNYERSLGPQVRDPGVLQPDLWSYTDGYDLADALVLAVESDLPGHEVCYVAAPDNATGRPFEEILRRYYGDSIPLRGPLPRPDSSGVSSARAQRVLGYRPTRSWRDYLDEDGRLRPELRKQQAR
jgi:nucleoside-diphosphate-sugar epimerase